jgi:hypothetical protein
MRRFIVLLAATFSVAVFPPLASSAAPVIERTFSGPFVISTEQCAFTSIIVTPRHDKLRILTFSDGRRIVTASYLATAYASINDEKSLELNLSGQARIRPTAEGGQRTIRTGTNLLLRPGALLLVHGPIVIEQDSQGNFTTTIVGRNVTDLCEYFRDP